MKRKQVWIYLSTLVAMWCGFDFLRIFLTFAGNMTIGTAIIGIIEIVAIAAVLYKIGCFGEKKERAGYHKCCSGHRNFINLFCGMQFK